MILNGIREASGLGKVDFSPIENGAFRDALGAMTAASLVALCVALWVCGWQYSVFSSAKLVDFI